VSPRAEGKHLQGKFAYLDAVSLYPSAILYVCEKLGGYPTGPCEMLSPEQLNYDFLRTQTTEFTVTIEITAIGKKQRDIPFLKVALKDSIQVIMVVVWGFGRFRNFSQKPPHTLCGFPPAGELPLVLLKALVKSGTSVGACAGPLGQRPNWSSVPKPWFSHRFPDFGIFHRSPQALWQQNL
jgi:hypothetical protein